jgi:hypothetical protein
MRRYRRCARFVTDPRQHCRPLDRNERAKILFMAEQLERRTKPVGRRNGVVSQIGLRVLRALVRFLRHSDGYCAPSYVQLMAVTGLCKQSVANGLRRLEACGILRIRRRLVREVVDTIVVCRQGSNLYAIHEPGKHADQIPVRAAQAGSFPRPAYAALSKLLGWNRPSPRNRLNPTQGFQIRGISGEAA